MDQAMQEKGLGMALTEAEHVLLMLEMDIEEGRALTTEDLDEVMKKNKEVYEAAERDEHTAEIGKTDLENYQGDFNEFLAKYGPPYD